MIGSTCAVPARTILTVNRFRSRGVLLMRNADSFDSRTAGRRAVAWLLLLVLPLTAAGPLAAARPPQGGASPAPAPSEPPAQAPAAAADQGMPAAPAAPERSEEHTSELQSPVHL